MENKSKRKESYEDYSSGRVLYGAPGATNFPVSLAMEIFEECVRCLEKNRNFGPYIIYDPFCGVAYSMTVLGFLYGSKIKNIFASDIDKTILEFAGKNLSLLTKKGIDFRVSELKKFIQDYKKESHKEALTSAERLKEKILNLKLKANCFQLDILGDTNLPKDIKNIDIVIADLPYGKLTSWIGIKDKINPTQIFLDKIKNRLNNKSVVAIASNKKQEIQYKGYTKIKTLKVPKRKVVFLTPARIILAG